MKQAGAINSLWTGNSWLQLSGSLRPFVFRRIFSFYQSIFLTGETPTAQEGMAASGGSIAQRRLNKREYACQTEKILAEKSVRRLLCISMDHGHIEQHFHPEGRANPQIAGLQCFLWV